MDIHNIVNNNFEFFLFLKEFVFKLGKLLFKKKTTPNKKTHISKKPRQTLV